MTASVRIAQHAHRIARAQPQQRLGCRERWCAQVHMRGDVGGGAPLPWEAGGKRQGAGGEGGRQGVRVRSVIPACMYCSCGSSAAQPSVAALGSCTVLGVLTILVYNTLCPLNDSRSRFCRRDSTWLCHILSSSFSHHGSVLVSLHHAFSSPSRRTYASHQLQV